MLRKSFMTIACFFLFVASGVGTWFAFSHHETMGIEATGIPSFYVRNSVIDLGLFAQGEEKTARFELINSGSHIVKINSIATECSCTTSDPKDKTIAPGQSIILPAKLTGPSIMAFEKEMANIQARLVISLEDLATHEQCALPLTITGVSDLTGRLSTIPGIIDFGKIVCCNQASRRVQFRGPGAVLDLLPKQIAVVNGALQNHVSIPYPGTDKGFATADVEFVFTPSPSDIPEVASSFLITVDGEVPQRILIPVKAMVLSARVNEK